MDLIGRDEMKIFDRDIESICIDGNSLIERFVKPRSVNIESERCVGTHNI